MYSVVVDSNIFVDFMMHRLPFYDNSKKVIELCEDNVIKGYVTSSILMDLHYIFKNKAHSSRTADMAIEEIIKVFEVIDVTKQDISNSISSNNGDFEDGIIESCSINNKINAIITRNIRDFFGEKIDVLTPDELLIRFK